MKVIGTAGHIDHGKSTLVRRLTGIDPDRLEEEKRRGMTIDLGFASLQLPSGQRAGIVDVPGHERFIKNMLAGATGIDVALLVVAADEGVMPQTREHVDILNLLGVRSAVVAVTKADAADPELIEIVRDDIGGLLQGTSLEGSPVAAVSAVTGEGLPTLLTLLDRALDEAPPGAEGGTAFLPVDRSFSVAGFGTVVTGTLHAGLLRMGQELEIAPRGRRGRVRTLQVHGETVDTAGPGTRVAVNLTGVGRDDIGRGDVLTEPGATPVTRQFDARVSVVHNAVHSLRHGTRAALHIGTTEIPAVLALYGRHALEAGETGWAQLRTPSAIPMYRGQRFVLRLPAPARTIAGGEIVDVAPSHRRRDREALDRLARLAAADADLAVLARLELSRPQPLRRLGPLLGLRASQIDEIVERLEASGRAVRLADAALTTNAWDVAVGRITETLSAYHTRFPLQPGMPREELRRQLRWTRPAWNAAVQRLEANGAVRDEGANIALPGHVGTTATRMEEAERVLAVLRRVPWSPPATRQLLENARTDEALLGALARENRVVRLSEDLVLDRGAYDGAVARVIELARSRGEVSVAEVRDALSTSRRVAVALLEFLDAAGITRRKGDARTLGRAAATCA